MGCYKVAKHCPCGYSTKDRTSYLRHMNVCKKRPIEIVATRPIAPTVDLTHNMVLLTPDSSINSRELPSKQQRMIRKEVISPPSALEGPSSFGSATRYPSSLFPNLAAEKTLLPTSPSNLDSLAIKTLIHRVHSLEASVKSLSDNYNARMHFMESRVHDLEEFIKNYYM